MSNRRVLKIPIIIAIFFVLSCAFAVNSPPLNKEQEVQHSLAVIENTLAIAQRHLSEQERHRLLSMIIGKVHDPPILARVAMISRILYFPGDAGDLKFDDAFDYAFWGCIRRLSKMNDKEASEAFCDIEYMLDLKGGDKIRFEAFRDRCPAVKRYPYKKYP